MLEELFINIEKTNSVSDLFNCVKDAAKHYGSIRYSYHFTPAYEKQTSGNTIVKAEGFPDDWIALYQDDTFRKSDPITNAILRTGRPMSWTAALLSAEDCDETRKFMLAAQSQGLDHGIGLPLFGPNGREAYASFGFEKPLGQDLVRITAILHALMEAVHLRICALVHVSGDYNLSAREVEILQWVSRGKSNRDIGTILGISAETVKTHLDRIYTKLGSRDRVGATVRP